MRGQSTWSYAPYKPFFFDTGDIYICRVVPYEHSIHFEWLSVDAEQYEVYCKLREADTFVLVGTTDQTFFDIEGLEYEKDYELYVKSGSLESRRRLARPGEYIGTTVNYLHPEDGAYAYSGQYLCSPSLVRHPDGYLLASMDLFGVSPQNLTLIFRSDDDGETWHYVSELYPCFWGKLFIHNNELYMLGCSTEYGDLLIGKSVDGGKTFCAPTVLLRGSCQHDVAGVHKNPQNIVVYNGRIYETLEWGAWAVGYHAPMVMSCDINDDLLVAENWHFTPPVKYDSNWEGVAKGPSTGNIEGTLAIAPDGTLYNIMRYDMNQTEPGYGLVLAYKVNTQDPDAPLEYSHAIALPGNHSKFMIKKDEKNRMYYTIISRIDVPERAYRRNLLSLMRSADLKNWELVSDLFDFRDHDMEKVGFQYVDFEIEDDDMLILIRTALNNAHNYHDANYSTFYRLKDFNNI